MKIKKSVLKRAVRSEVVSQLRMSEVKRKNLNEVAQMLRDIVKTHGLRASSTKKIKQNV